MNLKKCDKKLLFSSAVFAGFCYHKCWESFYCAAGVKSLWGKYLGLFKNNSSYGKMSRYFEKMPKNSNKNISKLQFFSVFKYNFRHLDIVF